MSSVQHSEAQAAAAAATQPAARSRAKKRPRPDPAAASPPDAQPRAAKRTVLQVDAASIVPKRAPSATVAKTPTLGASHCGAGGCAHSGDTAARLQATTASVAASPATRAIAPGGTPGAAVAAQPRGDTASAAAGGASTAAASASGVARVSKRQGVVTWDEYFMAVAFLSSQRSKDPSTQVGACIVNESKKIVGIGYNGFPNGCSDDLLPWARTADDELDTKYPYVCHAEMNAIMNKNSENLAGCKMYVALFPCNECAKLIIQSGIREVIFVSDKYHDTPMAVASRRLLDMAGVSYRKFVPQAKEITIRFG